MDDIAGARDTRTRNAAALLLGLAGVAASWSQFLPYLSAKNWSAVAFWTEAFTTFGMNGLTVDLFATAFVLFVMVWHDRGRLGGSKIAAIVCVTAILGVCFGLPLWLVWRDPE